VIRVTRVRLVAIGLLVVAFGCSRGGDSADPSRPPNEAQRTVRPGQHGPIVEGEYDFSGALDISGDYSVLFSFADEDANTCAKLAGEDASGYVVPLPTFKDKRRFAWTAGIRAYDGPGTYDLEALERFKLEVRKTADAEPVSYAAVDGTTARLEVSEDNSGSFTFAGLENDEGDKVSGEATWSCTEGSEGRD
jgi:hypothetical protein